MIRMMTEIDANNIIKSGYDSIDFPLEYNKPFNHYYVIESNGVMGYIVLWIDREFAQIINLHIFPMSRGIGYGKKLLKESMKKLKRVGVFEVSLEVRESNEIAVNLYKHNGFYVVTKRENYYKNEDGLLMVKKLRD